MRKMIAAIAAVLMLGSTAFAADYTPGQKITFDGTEASVWDGEVKDINKENYSISTQSWDEGKSLIDSVEIDDEEEELVITLKPDYKSKEDKTLKGTIKLREKGTSKYVTLTIDATVGYAQGQIIINAAGDVSLSTSGVESDTVYTVISESNNHPYGTLTFSADSAEVEVRVYEDDVYYLGYSVSPIKSVLQANADSDAEISFLTFEGAPTFTANATVTFYDLEEDGHVYEMKDGKLVETSATWDEDASAFVLKSKTLGSYVLSDKALKNVSSSSSDSGSSSNGSVTNPDTGANDVIGVAAALGIVALISAAAVSMKKK